MARTGYIVFGIWFTVAFALIAIGAGIFLSDRAFVARSIAVEGEVASVNHSYVNSEQRWTAYAIWRDGAGTAHDYTLYASSAATYGAGDRIALRYDPARPSDVRTDDLPIGAFIVGGIGVVFLALGVSVVVGGLRRDRARARGDIA